MAWVLDAEVESTPLSTTGGHTWEAARRLAAYLSAAAGELGLRRPGLRLLELGSGTGWLGANVARNMPEAALVVLTEQPDGLAHLRRNVALNSARGLPVGHVRVQSCDWRAYGPEAAAGSGGKQDSVAGCGSSAAGGSGDGPAAAEGKAAAAAAAGAAAAGVDPAAPAPALTSAEEQQKEELDLAAVPWDFIIGSDLIYNEIGSRCLPRVLAALARPQTQVLYCHTKHRFDLLDMEFLEQLEACGLCCEEVWEPGVPPPPQSPPLRFPPTDLFPEQRIAVYRITQRQQQPEQQMA
ncbi:Nicotinamide N-methyltransferase-like [Chlorella sorokiniana]|uniref:Nicotinamide N-methyltransferase-like n=1 Tax=Chlorella sorokiniana TaxID=3076 RepID=A0A2P6TV26_CHLSO|nr:Nicotinamide N-methyltransferase-like [Chlorella sorokiniana]|eukprot:PRW57925.1 Nicotinamide N-methyltransferase-like [Chlorella sorokiniana]